MTDKAHLLFSASQGERGRQEAVDLGSFRLFRLEHDGAAFNGGRDRVPFRLE